MTTTKMVYVAAAILPFGFVVLAVVVLVHAIWLRRRAATSGAGLAAGAGAAA